MHARRHAADGTHVHARTHPCSREPHTVPGRDASYTVVRRWRRPSVCGNEPMNACMCIPTHVHVSNVCLSHRLASPSFACRGAADRVPVLRIFIRYLYCTTSAPRAALRAASPLSPRPPRDARAAHCAHARTCEPCACRGTLGMPWPRHRGLGRAHHPSAVAWTASCYHWGCARARARARAHARARARARARCQATRRSRSGRRSRCRRLRRLRRCRRRRRCRRWRLPHRRRCASRARARALGRGHGLARARCLATWRPPPGERSA
jgi:hypothetical protein